MVCRKLDGSTIGFGGRGCGVCVNNQVNGGEILRVFNADCKES